MVSEGRESIGWPCELRWLFGGLDRLLDLSDIDCSEHPVQTLADKAGFTISTRLYGS
jgi:hypothetical protein